VSAADDSVTCVLVRHDGRVHAEWQAQRLDMEVHVAVYNPRRSPVMAYAEALPLAKCESHRFVRFMLTEDFDVALLEHHELGRRRFTFLEERREPETFWLDGCDERGRPYSMAADLGRLVRAQEGTADVVANVATREVFPQTIPQLREHLERRLAGDRWPGGTR
jgi:hypothetical protein